MKAAKSEQVQYHLDMQAKLLSETREEKICKFYEISQARETHD